MAKITGINITQPLAVFLEILLNCLGERGQSRDQDVESGNLLEKNARNY